MNTTRLLSVGLFIAGLVAPALQAAQIGDGESLTLWYDKPAAFVKGHGSPTLVNEALAIGNGHIGALIQGEPASELLRLNEDSLWTGSATDKGAYQALADISISLSDQSHATAYRRDLDLSQSIAHVTYQNNGVHYEREYFASHPANVLIVHLTADHPGSYTGTVSLTDRHAAKTIADAARLTAAGALPGNGLLYETQLLVQNANGSVKTTGDKIEFKNCDALTLIISAGTDYAMDPDKAFRGPPPHAFVTASIDAAAQQPYESLKTQHVQDYQSLFDRCTIELGQSSPEQQSLPTDERKKAAANAFDPQLEQLLFQYGRYLLISCSRPGGLPANLQGLWNDSNTPPWGSDYHANINVQMNYWPVEVTNLAECHLPLFSLVQSQLPDWRKATADSKDLLTPSSQPSTRGWAIRTSHNIYGHTDWHWDKTANAWYCHHFWEHFAFSQDKDFLANVAYPIMKETCQFWEDHLKTLPDGRLAVPNGWSPEHGPTQDGVSYNQQIVWDLFNNYVEASQILGIDADYRARVKALRDKLVAPAIGSWGQLLEWMTELHDPKGVLDTPNDHHRHTSHLFAVYPGRQISITLTPPLAAAAEISLKARGNTGDVREWSYAWRTALFARLHDAADAHDQLMHFFGTTTLNLLGNHPPMQMDGNFGMSAAIAEMLLQSHEGEINLLPALPREWATGSARGLRARGGFEIDLSWKNGQLTTVTVHSTAGSALALRYGSASAKYTLKPGSSIELDSALSPVSH